MEEHMLTYFGITINYKEIYIRKHMQMQGLFLVKISEYIVKKTKKNILNIFNF